MADGAAKHPDVEEGKPVNFTHEWDKAYAHALFGLHGWKRDSASGQHPFAHTAMRALKMLWAVTGGKPL